VKISVSIIVFNEEDNIADLCETVSWADEIVIVDSNSTDRTIEIAKKYTDKIFQREFRGFQDKHEFADSMTTGDWIFWIDADERVTPELLRSIEMARTEHDQELPAGFRIARKTWYEGRWIMHSGWYPDYQMRLYRKADSYWDGVAPHQTARVKGEIGTLDGELLHYTKRDLSEHHRVTDAYTTLAAEHLANTDVKSSASKMFFSSVAAFVRTYFLKQGFRDGVQGLMIAMFTAYGVFLKYAKVWERHNLKK
jgi:Glycosyltransferases involved in cell wall biogenesis